MRKRIVIGLMAVLAVVVVAYVVSQPPKGAPKAADLVITTFLQPIPTQRIETTNQAQVMMIKKWIQAARSTQPPPNQLGAVMPWCEIRFFDLENDAKKEIEMFSIYSIRDRTTGHELLSADQRRKLLDIFELKEAEGGKQYILK